MSLARMIVDGWSWMVTRRCVEQKFFMRPDRRGVVANTYRYTLAHAAEETKVQLHAYVAMGNHLLCAAAHKTCYAELGVMRSWRTDAALEAEFGARRCT